MLPHEFWDSCFLFVSLFAFFSTSVKSTIMIDWNHTKSELLLIKCFFPILILPILQHGMLTFKCLYISFQRFEVFTLEVL